MDSRRVPLRGQLRIQTEFLFVTEMNSRTPEVYSFNSRETIGMSVLTTLGAGHTVRRVNGANTRSLNGKPGICPVLPPQQ